MAYFSFGSKPARKGSGGDGGKGGGIAGGDDGGAATVIEISARSIVELSVAEVANTILIIAPRFAGAMNRRTVFGPGRSLPGGRAARTSGCTSRRRSHRRP